MNTIDIVLGLILVIAFFIGFSKGLLRALASLIGIVVAVYSAMFLSGFVGAYLMDWFNWSHNTTNIAAFVVTFVLVIILFSLLGRVLTKVADLAMLGIFNKLLGGIFNVLKYAFLVSVVFMYVNASDSYRILSEEKRAESVLYGPVASIAPAILPSILKEVEDLENTYDEPINEELPEASESSSI